MLIAPLVLRVLVLARGLGLASLGLAGFRLLLQRLLRETAARDAAPATQLQSWAVGEGGVSSAQEHADGTGHQLQSSCAEGAATDGARGRAAGFAEDHTVTQQGAAQEQSSLARAQANSGASTTTETAPAPPRQRRDSWSWFAWRSPPALLPPQKGPPRKTLVLDLDQTLIECLHLSVSKACAPDFTYTDCEGLQANVWTRPHLLHFLQTASVDFEIVLFTAAAQRHADAVLAVLDPSGTLVEHRLYGHHTVSSPQWGWVKDLSRLGRDLSQTLIVDDCHMAALWQPSNWVSIRPFSHTAPDWRSDTALLDILAFLRDKVLPAQDVRTALAEHYSQAARAPVAAAPPPPSPGMGAACAGDCSPAGAHDDAPVPAAEAVTEGGAALAVGCPIPGDGRRGRRGSGSALEDDALQPSSSCSSSSSSSSSSLCLMPESLRRVSTIRSCLATSHC